MWRQVPPLQIESTERGGCIAPLFHCEEQFIWNRLVVVLFHKYGTLHVICNWQVYKYKHMITSRGNVLYPATRVTQSRLYRKGCNKPHPVVVTAQIGCGTLYLAVEKPTQLMPLISVAAGGQCFVELVWYTASVSTFKV